MFLHEELLLLALRDEEGTIQAGSFYAYAIAGALLAELVVRGRIRMTGPEKKRMVELVDSKLIGEPLLDESLARIASAKRRGSAVTWVGKLAASRKLKDRLADGLCRRGILRAEDRDVLLFFKRRVYPTLDPGPEREIVERLRKAIFEDGEVEARTIVLLSLADRAGLLKFHFGKKEIKSRRARIDALAESELAGKAVASAVEAMQVAMMVIITSG